MNIVIFSDVNRMFMTDVSRSRDTDGFHHNLLNEENQFQVSVLSNPEVKLIIDGTSTCKTSIRPSINDIPISFHSTDETAVNSFCNKRLKKRRLSRDHYYEQQTDI